jgi:hypothetical protein
VLQPDGNLCWVPLLACPAVKLVGKALLDKPAVAPERRTQAQIVFAISLRTLAFAIGSSVNGLTGNGRLLPK